VRRKPRGSAVSPFLTVPHRFNNLVSDQSDQLLSSERLQPSGSALPFMHPARRPYLAFGLRPRPRWVHPWTYLLGTWHELHRTRKTTNPPRLCPAPSAIRPAPVCRFGEGHPSRGFARWGMIRTAFSQENHGTIKVVDTSGPPVPPWRTLNDFKPEQHIQSNTIPQTK
jgi:hypothetical protein